MAKKITGDEIMGLREIADLLEVQPRTPHIWKYRKLLPPPDVERVNCSSAWKRSTVVLWAAQTNRLNHEDPKVQASLKREAKKYEKANA